MITIFGFLTLFLFSIAPLNAETPINDSPSTTYRSARPDPQQNIQSFHYMKGVSKTDFIASGATSMIETFSIINPGTYVLVQDIGWKGRDASESQAIYINSNNVTLDLGGKTLYNNSGATTTSIQKGISVASGKYNIAIKNGNLADFQDTGIEVNFNCANVRIQDVTITHCDKHGVYLKGTNEEASSEQEMITNCVIDNCMVGRSTGIGTTDAYGIQLDECFNILVSNSTFSRNDSGTLSADAIGAYVKSCTNVVFNNCDASGNRGDDAFGFKVDSSSVACSFVNCTANGNWGEHATTNGKGYGFYADTVHGCSWENCTASGNEGTTVAYGFYYGTTQFCQTTGCSSYNSRGGSSADAAGEGSRSFYSISGTGNIWKDCTAVGCTISLGTDSGFTAMECIGFDLQTEKYSILRGCESRNHNNNDHYPWGIGVNLSGTTDCVVQDCKIMHNKSETANHGIGLRDTNGTSSTLVTDCFFFNNGEDTTSNNYHLSYTSPGELNITTTVNQGGMSGLVAVKPYQNVTVVTAA